MANILNDIREVVLLLQQRIANRNDAYSHIDNISNSFDHLYDALLELSGEGPHILLRQIGVQAIDNAHDAERQMRLIEHDIVDLLDALNNNNLRGALQNVSYIGQRISMFANWARENH